MNVNTASAWLKLVTVFLSLITANAAFAASEDAILERIKPVAQVCVEGDANCGSAASAASGPKSGEDVFKTSCFGCHGTGLATAPQIGDKAAWKPRLAQGLETLYKHAIEGFGNGMPPKGTCMSCSDDEIKAAIDHILAQSK